MNSLSESLIHARKTNTTVPSSPWANVVTGPERAYAVMDEVAAAMGWFGSVPPRHWKSGGPSRAEPATHAPLPPAGVLASPADVSAWPLHLRAVEPEIALRLKVDVTPEDAARLTAEEVDALIDAMAVAIEVVDSRWDQGFDAPALLRFADQQSHAGLVLGDWVPYARRDWTIQRCELHIGDAPAQHFTGTHSLGDPAWLLPAWLRHATQRGTTVFAGTIVTTGSWAGAVMGKRGDLVQVAFDGVGTARVRL